MSKRFAHILAEIGEKVDYDVVAPFLEDGKTVWKKIGVAWRSRRPTKYSYTIKLTGQFQFTGDTLYLYERKAKNQ